MADNVEELRRRLAVCHNLLDAAKGLIDPEIHPEWDQAVFDEQQGCERTFEENERLRTALAALIRAYLDDSAHIYPHLNATLIAAQAALSRSALRDI